MEGAEIQNAYEVSPSLSWFFLLPSKHISAYRRTTGFPHCGNGSSYWPKQLCITDTPLVLLHRQVYPWPLLRHYQAYTWPSPCSGEFRGEIWFCYSISLHFRRSDESRKVFPFSHSRTPLLFVCLLDWHYVVSAYPVLTYSIFHWTATTGPIFIDGTAYTTISTSWVSTPSKPTVGLTHLTGTSLRLTDDERVRTGIRFHQNSFKMTLHYVAFHGVKFDVEWKVYAFAIYTGRTLAVDFGICFINNFYDVHLATYRPSLSTSTSNTPPNSCISLTVVSLLVCPSTNQISCQCIVVLCFAVSYRESTKGLSLRRYIHKLCLVASRSLVKQ